MMIYYRWSDHDRRWGRFIYARDRRDYRPFGIELTSSGDEDEQPFATLRMQGFGHTLIVVLPPIVRAARGWREISTEPTRSQMIARGRKPGYWDIHAREYGFQIVMGGLHLHYGQQTGDSDTDRSRVWSFPWLEYRLTRRSHYGLAGEHVADEPLRATFAGMSSEEHRAFWAAQEAARAAAPTKAFAFTDFDGEQLTATTRIEEREWKRGVRRWRWLSLIWPKKVRRSLDIRFSGEVGHRKGSWKGGTIGHSIDLRAGELHEDGFRRYCVEQGLTYRGLAA